MAIHPTVRRGLDPYRQGDHSAARDAFEDAAAAVEGDEHSLLQGLADLAAAAVDRAEGRRSEAARLLAAARLRLAKLPARLLGVDVEALRAALEGDPDRVLAEPPAIEPARLLPPWVLLRFLLLVAVVGAGFFVLRYTEVGAGLARLLEPERLESVRESVRGTWWTPFALVGLFAVLAPLGAPVSPLMLAGGAIFGALWGSLLNILGCFIGAALSFFLARWLGRDLVTHLVGDRLRRVERLVERRGFLPLVRIRFIPIPFPVVNYGAALAGVPASLFLVTTAIGLTPAVFLYTYFAAAIVDAVGGDQARIFLHMGLAVIGVFALTFLPNVLQGLGRRRRYRRLVAERRSRHDG